MATEASAARPPRHIPPRGPLAAFRRLASRSIGALVGVTIVAVVVAAAAVGPAISPWDPVQPDTAKRFTPPGWRTGTWAHPLGTDALGRDLLTRIVAGARVSLAVGLAAVLASGTVGVTVGLLAGYHRGWLDDVVMRIADVQLAIPFLILAIALAAVLGGSLRNVVLVLAITGWVLYARIVRSEVLSVRERDYIEAARAAGATDWRVLGLHVLPNVHASIIVTATLEVARMILAEASLSFLGLGVPPTVPTWGGMIAESRVYLSVAWWAATFPGLATFITVLGVNLFGDWLRSVLDPRQRGVQ
jgi:peptide/nickel transport system permease protein